MADTVIRVKETTTTTGPSAAYALGGASYGFQTFSAQLSDLDTVLYKCEDLDPDAETGQWEYGIGTFNSGANTLSRTTILLSSNSNLAVNWGTGTRDVYGVLGVTMIAENNLSEVTPATARTNLGLGDAATKNVGSGNGLDADTVDTVEAGALVKLAGAETVSGAKTFSGAVTFSGDTTHNGDADYSGGVLVIPVGADKYAT